MVKKNTTIAKPWLILFSLLIFCGILVIFEVLLRFHYCLLNPFPGTDVGQVPKRCRNLQVDQFEFNIPYRYNSRGFRGEEIEPLAKGTKRILFLGDSFTEGFGVDENDRFSNRVIAKLGVPYQQINLGQLATNPDIYLKNLQQAGIYLDPELVIFCVFIGNDFMGGRYVKRDSVGLFKKPQDLEKLNDSKKAHVIYLNELLRQTITKEKKLVLKKTGKNYWELYFNQKIDLAFHAKMIGRKKEELKPAISRMNPQNVLLASEGKIHFGIFQLALKAQLGIPEKSEDFYNEPDYQNTFFSIREAFRLTTSHRKKFLVLVIPDVTEIHENEFFQNLAKNYGIKEKIKRLEELPKLHRRLVSDLVRESIPFVDPSSLLKQATGLSYYLNDCHMNRQGHQILADALISEIRPALRGGIWDMEDGR